MTEAETTRFLLGLREAGWSAERINNFLLYIASGEEQYKPGIDADRKDR